MYREVPPPPLVSGNIEVSILQSCLYFRGKDINNDIGIIHQWFMDSYLYRANYVENGYSP